MAKTKKQRKPILDVIDGHNWLNRAYYAAAKLTTKDGVHTGAVKAFVMMVNKLIRHRMETRGECYLVVAFDNKTRDTFRSKMMIDFLTAHADNLELLPEKFVTGYKGNRQVDEEKVSELGPQFEIAKAALEARGIKTYRIKGYEADDVLGTLALKCACNVMIWSRDKDFAQLLSSTVRITQQEQGKSPEVLIKPSTCIDVFGLKPNQIVDFLALSGDGVDNIPGIPGVGSKTAINLLTEHGNIKGILNAEIKGKLGEKLKHPFYRNVLKLSKQLAQIHTSVPGVDTDFRNYKLKDVSAYTKKMDKFARSIEFKQLFTS